MSSGAGGAIQAERPNRSLTGGAHALRAQRADAFDRQRAATEAVRAAACG